MSTSPEQIFLVTPNEVTSEVPRNGQAQEVNLENVKDFSNVCRTCAAITDLVVPIFSGEGLQNNLAEKIKKHLPIQVKENDNLPMVVCCQCFNTLLAWHELVQCCVQADTALRTKQAVLAAKKAAQAKKPAVAGPSRSTPAAAPTPTDVTSQADEACMYCSWRGEHGALKGHLMFSHGEHVFHCADCGRVLPRLRLISHMTKHAHFYARHPELPRSTMPLALPPELTEQAHENAQLLESDQGSNVSNGTEESDEFSDCDQEFDCIPDSVFDAIAELSDPPAASQPAANRPAATQPAANRPAAPQPAANRLAATQPAANQPTAPQPAAGRPVATEHDALPPATETQTQPATELEAAAPAASAEARPATARRQRTCTVCAKVYTAPSSYFYHVRHGHEDSEARAHACGVCQRRFSSKAELARHASQHTSEPGFACDVCGKKFRTNASLYIHRETHGSERGCECDTCGRKFRWKQQLKRHMARHAAARAHTCTTCGRGFNVRCDLLRHQQTHAAARLRCDTCGAAFSQARYLRVHQTKKHHAPRA